MKITCPKCQSQYEAPWFIQENKEGQYHCPVCSKGQDKSKLAESKSNGRVILND